MYLTKKPEHLYHKHSSPLKMSLAYLFSLFTQIAIHINEVVLPASSGGRRPSRQLNALYKLLCLFYSLRCIAISFAMRYHYRSFLDRDIFWKYYNHDHVYDSNAILSAASIGFTSAYFRQL